MEKRLNPSDIVVALRLALHPREQFRRLAEALEIGVGSAYRSIERLRAAGLVRSDERVVNRLALSEFLKHGLRYVFFAVPGPPSRGVPTAYAAPPLSAEFLSDEAVVWPSPDGEARGISIAPLYDGAPRLPDRDPELYEVLALVDALRFGQARERKRAAELLDERLLAVDRPPRPEAA